MRSKLVVLLVSPHFWRQTLVSEWMMRCARNTMINLFFYHFFPYFLISHKKFHFSQLRKNLFSAVMENSYLCLWITCRCGVKLSDVHFRRISSVQFLPKEGKDASHEGRNGWKGVFSRQSRHLHLNVGMMKILSSIRTLTWRVNNYVFRRKKGVIMRNESTEGHNNFTDAIEQ